MQTNSSSDTLLPKYSSKAVAVTCGAAVLKMAGKSSLINANSFESEAVLAKPRVLLLPPQMTQTSGELYC